MAQCQAGTYQYVVQRGDSLWLIGQRFRVTVQQIAAANPGIDAGNLYVGQIICVPASNVPNPETGGCISSAQVSVGNRLRMLWEQHVYWTRMAIISMAFGLPDTKVTTERLLENPRDFEEALKPLYGEKVSSQFAKLFTSHLVIAAELVGDLKAGDASAAAETEKRWYANANEIADFLGSVNTYWSAAEWRRLLNDHLAMTREEAAAVLAGQYAKSVAIFGNIEKEALVMADAMTQGIVRQFPQYF